LTIQTAEEGKASLCETVSFSALRILQHMPDITAVDMAHRADVAVTPQTKIGDAVPVR
jgi:hypothetical protein